MDFKSFKDLRNNLVNYCLNNDYNIYYDNYLSHRTLNFTFRDYISNKEWKVRLVAIKQTGFTDLERKEMWYMQNLPMRCFINAIKDDDYSLLEQKYNIVNLLS